MAVLSIFAATAVKTPGQLPATRPVRFSFAELLTLSRRVVFSKPEKTVRLTGIARETSDGVCMS